MSHASQPGWAAPLPDLSRPALSQRLRIGGRELQLEFSAVQHEPPGEPGTDLVQFWVLYGGRPLATLDAEFELPNRAKGKPDALSGAWSRHLAILLGSVLQFCIKRLTVAARIALVD